MWDYEINAFGERLGLSALALNTDERATLAIDGIGTVTLQKTGTQTAPELALILSRPMESAEATAAYQRLVQAVHWKRFAERPVQAALFRGALIVTVRFAETDVSAAALENGLRVLMMLLDAAQG